MQAHRAKFNGATGNGRTSVTPLTLNNRRIENRLGGNRVVTTIASSNTLVVPLTQIMSQDFGKS
jgi:hypothetical protein